MSDLIIYGTPASRTVRTLWMVKELDLDYAHDPVDFRDGGTRTADFARINPNARIPAIRDGDLVLWESTAINLYLAKKHGGPLTPKTAEEEAHALQWSLWALSDIESRTDVLIQQSLKPEAERDARAIEVARAALPKPLAVLEQALAKQSFILGDRFTVADLNVAGIVRALPRVGYDLATYPRVVAWLQACLARPAAVAAVDMQKAAMAALR